MQPLQSCSMRFFFNVWLSKGMDPLRFPGGHRAKDTPVPIPNTAVKLRLG